uniref:Putative capsid protein n=1 Tax=viral metagenome TaxID=1070528 RepID=A0A6M3IN78_9ZZZZ
MAESGGHWNNLAEVAKLSQSTLVPGVIEETIKRGSVLGFAPLSQAADSGTSIKWNRESTTMEASVQDISIGEGLSWTEAVTYDQQETTLKISYLGTKLDNFVRDIYGNRNNYEAIRLMELQKAVMLKLGDKFIYDDVTYGGAKQFDGLHALAAENSGNLNIDEGEGALSIMNIRLMIDAMKHGCDGLFMSYVLARRIDASVQEAGIASYAGMGSVSFAYDEMGKRVSFFDGIPIVRSDYLVAEQVNTGAGSDARAKNTGTAQYSIFGIKFGQVMLQQPGLSIGFGGTNGMGEFFKVRYFAELPEYDAGGIQVLTYVAPLLGSSMGLGRIYDITDAAVTA